MSEFEVVDNWDLWFPGRYLNEFGLPDVKRVTRWVCPECGRVERQESVLEPCCTGPSWTNDHELTLMERVDA